MKLFIILTVAISSFLNADYLMHPKTDALVKELVDIHGFEKKYVEEVLSNAEKKQKIIDSISKPAEFTWTWDRYKKLFIEKKRIWGP